MAEPYLDCPSSWHRSTLEPDPQSGLVIRVDGGNTPRTSREEYWDGDIPWLTPKEVARQKDGLYVSETERTITELGLSSCAARLLEPGTVMLTKRAPVGGVAVNVVPMATNQGFLNFQCGERLRPLYLAYWFLANKPYLDRVANGSTYPELYPADLFEFEISVPPVDEQDRIIEVISAFQLVTLLGLPLEQSVVSPQDMIAIQRQSRRLRAIREVILPLLLSGRPRVPTVVTKFSGTVK